MPIGRRKARLHLLSISLPKLIGQRYKRPGTINVSYLPVIAPGEPGTLFTLKAQALLEAEKRVLA